MFLYDFMNLAAVIVMGLCWLMLICCAWEVIKNRTSKESFSIKRYVKEINNQTLGVLGSFAKPILIVALIANIVTDTTVHQLVGVHSLPSKPTGTYCFYVEASRYGGKTYTLPAEIRVEIETEDVGNDKTETRKCYYIEKVFFSNGGWLDTADLYSIEINETVHFCDYDTDDEWKLTLINKHAYTPYVTETDNATPADVARMLADNFPIAFVLFALCRKEHSDDDSNE